MLITESTIEPDQPTLSERLGDRTDDLSYLQELANQLREFVELDPTEHAVIDVLQATAEAYPFRPDDPIVVAVVRLTRLSVESILAEEADEVGD